VTTAVPEDHPGIRVRQAERPDLLAVYRIETGSFPQPWPFGAFEQYLGEPGFLVATDDAVLGYIVGDRVMNRRMAVGHIKNLAVHEEYRGQGVGRALLGRGIDVLTEQGVEALKLEVRAENERALELYHSCGFEHRATIEGYYEDGEDALLLVCDI